MTTFTSQNALFAPIFADEEIDALFSTEAMVGSFTQFEIALTGALAEVGRVDSDLAKKALAGMEKFVPDIPAIADRIVADGLPVPGYVAQLKAHLGEELASVVHVGTTSQDLIDSSFAISFARATDVLDQRLSAVLASLSDLARDYGGNSMMGRTRMQAALPISVAHRITTWQQPLIQLHADLKTQRSDIAQLQFGGPVGDCAAFGDDAATVGAAIAKRMGLVASDTSWHTDRHGLIAFGNLLSQISGALGKFGQDACLMAQQGIDEIKLKGGGKSSAMPHKQNPIPAELLVTLARYNATQIGGLHQALVHEQERSGVMWTLEWMILPEMVRVTAKSLLVAQDLLARIERIGTP